MAKNRIPKNDPVKKRLLKYLGTDYHESYDETIDLYVETYYYYQKIRKEIDKSDLMYEYTNKAGATNQIKNPLMIEIPKAVQTLNNLLKSIGLTPAQRKEVAEGAGGDSFEDF